MKLEKLFALAELASSIAVVVTLVFLTVQVRQNTDALNAQSRQSVLTAAQSELFKIIDHPDMLEGLSQSATLDGRREH